MSEWQPIETAPKGEPGRYKGGPQILGCIKADWGHAIAIVSYKWHANATTGNWKSSHGVWPPTHWMHLPEPPK